MVRRRAPSVEQVTRIMNGPSSLPPSQTPSRSNSSSDMEKPSKKDKKDFKDKHPDLLDPDSPRAILGSDDFNARAVRHATRVFLASTAGLKLYDAIQRKIFGKKSTGKKEPLHKSTTFRLSLSLSSILLLYRLLFRFFTRLRDRKSVV